MAFEVAKRIKNYVEELKVRRASSAVSSADRRDRLACVGRIWSSRNSFTSRKLLGSRKSGITRSLQAILSEIYTHIYIHASGEMGFVIGLEQPKQVVCGCL